jgi:hypothetical protein
MGDASELSMNDMPVHDHHHDWTDDHITVRYTGFNPANGEAKFEVTEHHDGVGVYYIWVIYGPESGPPPGPPSQASYTYDGAHPKRFQLMKGIRVETSRNHDTVRGIKVKKVSD